ncbi:MAG: prepilin-type N-terminal cleavage/methylation domain-containing protein [Candidatus Omnitrophica bacterium]|nr:prepilin-type N-terminal cleavage/methylation domain-containing protein [Candidatus Omnitrophota bacterium]
MKRGFTLTEILVVLVIIGILAAIAWPNYSTMKEKTLDREAKANLALMRAADRIYRMEIGYYYPYSGSVNTVSTINTDLRLSLPDTASPDWSYSIGSPTGIGRATRSGRTWTLQASGSSEAATCTGSCY